jgi:predicted dehydrogenase
MMEKPMGVSAAEVAGIAEKAAARNAFVAVPLPQRNSPFTVRARTMLAEGRFGDATLLGRQALRQVAVVQVLLGV